MERSFKPEYFILLDEPEMVRLVTAHNRNEFQPELRAFLQAMCRMGALRSLSLQRSDHEWIPPEFTVNEQDEIRDNSGNIRGYRHRLPLPARPGEAQMALSYDWFWHTFARFLNSHDIWSQFGATELLNTARFDPSPRIEEIWHHFWERLGSNSHLDQSVGVFLDNKSLFKNQAKPWDTKDIPILCEDMAQFLIHYYTKGRARKKHFKQGSIDKAVADLESAVRNRKYVAIPLRPNVGLNHFPGGDFTIQPKHIRCAACGEVVLKKESHKRLAVFLKDADERPQSATDKDKLSRYCKRCVATVFLCPVKLAPETLTVRFNPKNPIPEAIIESELKKYVAQTLHVNAGNYVSLHITDFLDRKPLSRVWGAYHYALWKMAVTFPPELFAQDFQVDVYPGEEQFSLPRWALWFVSALAQWDNVFEYNAYRKFNTPFSRFLRMISRKRIFQAFYTLISNEVIHHSYAQTWKMNVLQEIWAGLETLFKEENMPIPDYPMIAGFAGLLLPLAERVQSSKKSDNEKKRAITKLLEEADKPIQYAYTAARESNSPDFIFCCSPRNRYFFEKAMDLLAWAGEDVAALQKAAADKVEELAQKDDRFSWMKAAELKIFICPDQIARVTSALVSEKEKPYANEADWRAFAYQVKLALWSFFPRHLGSQEK